MFFFIFSKFGERSYFMSTAELIKDTHQKLDDLPEMLVPKVSAYIDELRRTEIIPELGCTLDEYNQEIDEAVESANRGETVSHEEAMETLYEIIRRKT